MMTNGRSHNNEEVTLMDNLFNYVINDAEFKKEVLSQFGIQSTVEMTIGGKTKSYGFIGCGCGITYLKIDKRSKKSVLLDNVVSQVRRRVNNYIYENWFSDGAKLKFEQMGCPVMAVLQQDQQCQIEFYHLVVKYAKEVMGIKKITYISNLD
jgi:hypothetical protein